ncbi:MAG: hypothetical protein EPO24_04895 [Bacteroidetes bacterium]|nr:MAG: hypothetical protein EPO24_04895 [Bacteroidota bacterium]
MKYFVIILLVVLLFGCSEESPVIVHSNITEFGATLVTINGNNSVTLAWGNLEDNYAITKVRFLSHEDNPIDGTHSEIRVYRGLLNDAVRSRLSRIATLHADETHYTDTLVENGNAYYYALELATIGSLGEEVVSKLSNIASATPFDFSAVTDIKYSTHIQPIFNSGCAYSHCHGSTYDDGHDVAAKSSNRFEKLTHNQNGFDITSWDAIMRGSDHGAVLVPYKSSKSHMFFHVNFDTLLGPISTPHMPFTGVNLPLEQVQLIKRWIDEGAKNDNGDVTLSYYPEGKVLVTNQADDLVAIVDIKTLLVSRYIQAGVANVFTQSPQAPHNITVDTANNCYYVNLVVAGKIVKYRLSDNEKLGEVSGILSPTQVALSADGMTGYSAQFAQNTNAIRIFNTQTMTLEAQQISSPFLNKPHGVQFTPDYSELWVTGNFSDNIMVAHVGVVTTTEMIPLIPNDTLPPGTGGRLQPYQTAITSDGRYVYVTCQISNEVRVIDRDSMKVTRIIAVGQRPLILAISPDDQYVYTANRNSNDVSVIRTSDNVVVQTIPNVGPQPHGIALSADGKYAFVTCENVTALVPPHHPTEGSKIPGVLSVIDLTTYSVIKKIEVGAFAAGVAVVE